MLDLFIFYFIIIFFWAAVGVKIIGSYDETPDPTVFLFKFYKININ